MSEDRLAELHQRAMSRFDAIWSAVWPERQQALADRRFATIRGAQWEGQYAVGDECDDAGDPIDTGSPRMEVPKFLRAIRRTAGEYRSSRQVVDFRPKDEDSDDASANSLDGLYRADLNDSIGGGQLAIDNAADEARKGGFGAWRYRAVFEDESDETNERQRIRIETIYDADKSVFWDLNAKAQDKSDARFGFILFTLTRDVFEEEYPDAAPATFDIGTQEWAFDWTRPDDLTLAEYFEVEDKSVLRRTFRQTVLDEAKTLDPDFEPEEVTHDDAELKEGGGKLLRDLKQKGFEEVRSRRIKRQQVRKYLLSGAECLSDDGVIAGKYIPIVPDYYERSFVDGVERSQGMVRPVIDASRIYNLMVSGLADAAGGPSEDTPIVAPEQVDTAILDAWASRKSKRPAVLLLKPIYGDDGQILQAGVSGTVPAAQVSQSMAALIQIAGSDIPDLMGSNDQPETVPSNTSAEAIQLVNDAGDVADALWRDNHVIALTQGGRIWLEMAKDLYVEPGRKMTAIDAEGRKAKVALYERIAGDKGEFIANDIAGGRFEVIVDVGPATKTKRDATVRSMAGIAQVYATAGNTANANAALGVAVLNMEGEGLDSFQEFVRKQGLTEGWVEPTEEEAAALQVAQQQQAVDPNMLIAQAQLATAQAENRMADARAIEAQAKLLTAQTNARLTGAKTVEVLSGVDRNDRKQLIAEAESMEHHAREEHSQALGTADALMRHEQHDNGSETSNGG